MKVPVLLLFSAACAFGAPAKVIFTKSFPGSDPAYEAVSVDRTGAMEYRENVAEDHPVVAKLSDPDTSALFDMAGQLNHFKDRLESGLKVANTGKKTFRFIDSAGVATETVFNYSTNVVASQLLDRFEQIGSSERAFLDLDRTVHFDKLGVNDSLAEIEGLWLKKQLAAPDQFVPLLNRIINHESFMHLARERAARLRDDFQGGTRPDPVSSEKGQSQQ